jgi:hypothetical protein
MGFLVCFASLAYCRVGGLPLISSTEITAVWAIWTLFTTLLFIPDAEANLRRKEARYASAQQEPESSPSGA